MGPISLFVSTLVCVISLWSSTKTFAARWWGFWIVLASFPITAWSFYDTAQVAGLYTASWVLVGGGLMGAAICFFAESDWLKDGAADVIFSIVLLALSTACLTFVPVTYKQNTSLWYEYEGEEVVQPETPKPTAPKSTPTPTATPSATHLAQNGS